MKTVIVEGKYGLLPLSSDINLMTVAVESGFNLTKVDGVMVCDNKALRRLIETIVIATRATA